jgi:hypothetical protein
MLMVSTAKDFSFFVGDEKFLFVELNCPPVSCGLGQFLCSRDSRCINATRRCDGIAGM